MVSCVMLLYMTLPPVFCVSAGNIVVFNIYIKHFFSQRFWLLKKIMYSFHVWRARYYCPVRGKELTSLQHKEHVRFMTRTQLQQRRPWTPKVGSQGIYTEEGPDLRCYRFTPWTEVLKDGGLGPEWWEAKECTRNHGQGNNKLCCKLGGLISQFFLVLEYILKFYSLI